MLNDNIIKVVIFSVLNAIVLDFVKTQYSYNKFSKIRRLYGLHSAISRHMVDTSSHI